MKKIKIIMSGGKEYIYQSNLNYIGVKDLIKMFSSNVDDTLKNRLVCITENTKPFKFLLIQV